MVFDDFISTVRSQSKKLSLDSLKQGTGRISSTLTSTLRSQTSKVGAVSADIAQRFRNDLHAWSSGGVLQNWNQGLSRSKSLGWLSDQASDTEEPSLEELGTEKEYGPSREEIENIVDKFIKVVTPNEDEEYQQVTRKSFRHMRNYNFYRRNDREMIRRKLAMGPEAEEVAALTGSGAGVGCPAARKPSLQSRLQGGMSLQICFMNETASDDEGGEDDDEDEFRSKSGLLTRQISSATQQVDESSSAQPLPVDLDNWPKFSQPPCVARDSSAPERAADFARHQAQLQREARLALAQAQQMARWQMDVERQSRRSPISDVVRQAFQKIGVSFPDGRRRVSRQILTEMNIAQLQLIVNDLHTRIEGLNEGLVRYLMERDELHMEQDSKLVHIEDLTSYYGQKHQGLRIQPTPTDPTDLTSVSGAASKPAKARSLRLSLSKNK